MKFKPLQKLVAKHYADGEFAHLTHVSEALPCHDLLFPFVIVAAGDAHDTPDFVDLLEIAINQLRSLQRNLPRVTPQRVFSNPGMSLKRAN